MKPWFEKEIQEADIIKFPEPERKVIKMPSVSEYPDFITGVQDLQARLKQGQIGQDSYDKLYQDLIQRFMKRESFESPWFLREATRKLVNGTDRGRMNEIILAVAIFSKFIAGSNQIGEKDIIKQLKTLAKFPGGFKRKNLENDPITVKIKDEGPTLVKDIKDIAKNLPLLKDEIAGNVDAANSDATADKLSKLYAENGKPDQVLVSQLGGDRGKTDVLLQYIEPGKEPKTLRPYSAKTFSDRVDNKDVNTIEALNNYFNSFGVNLNAKGIIDRSETAPELFKEAFKNAADIMNKLLAGDVEKNEKIFVKQVYNFIIQLGTKGDPNLLLIDNRKGKSTIYDFQLLMQNVDKVDLEVESKIVDKMPSIFVYDKNLGQAQGTLLQLRYSYGKSSSNPRGRHRILVDTGDLFKNLTLVVNKAKKTKRPTT